MQLIIHGSKHNRYSINALLGALETRGMLPGLPVVLGATAGDLWKAVRQLEEEAVIAFSFFSTQLATAGEAGKKSRPSVTKTLIPLAKESGSIMIGKEYPPVEPDNF